MKTKTVCLIFDDVTEKVADTLEEAKTIPTGKTLREVKVEAHVDPAD